MTKIHKCNVANQSDHLEMLKKEYDLTETFYFFQRPNLYIYMHAHIHI